MSTAVLEAQRELEEEEEGVVLTPEEEEELERASAEAKADIRAGRFVTADEVRAKLYR